MGVADNPSTYLADHCGRMELNVSAARMCASSTMTNPTVRSNALGMLTMVAEVAVMMTTSAFQMVVVSDGSVGGSCGYFHAPT